MTLSDCCFLFLGPPGGSFKLTGFSKEQHNVFGLSLRSLTGSHVAPDVYYLGEDLMDPLFLLINKKILHQGGLQFTAVILAVDRAKLSKDVS